MVFRVRFPVMALVCQCIWACLSLVVLVSFLLPGVSPVPAPVGPSVDFNQHDETVTVDAAREELEAQEAFQAATTLHHEVVVEGNEKRMDSMTTHNELLVPRPNVGTSSRSIDDEGTGTAGRSRLSSAMCEVSPGKKVPLDSLPAYPEDAQGHAFIFVGGIHHSLTGVIPNFLQDSPEVSGMTNTSVPQNEGQHIQKIYPSIKKFGIKESYFGSQPVSAFDEKSDLITPCNRHRMFESWARYWDLKKHFLLEKSPPDITKTTFLSKMFPPGSVYHIELMRHPLGSTQHFGKNCKDNRHLCAGHIESWIAVHDTLYQDIQRLDPAHVRVLRAELLAVDPKAVICKLATWLHSEHACFGTTVRRKEGSQLFPASETSPWKSG
eukprot:TRINITY_DN9313_c0_g1_i1.p1 TRINITY_DN9313_c0_g1~~TRINITY_DN9313_c0_g1_i1.p1  ORF type:complete len:380 (-),score=44.77 TRINITY_DN9313_c0_g1_i1:377-1516(-)